MMQIHTDVDKRKAEAAHAALKYIDRWDMTIGIGTGSTVNFLIDLLPQVKNHIEATVASSEASEERLKANGIPVVPLSSVDKIDIYIDGADEVSPHLNMIKGGGGALTREKIVASASLKFICIADAAKQVDLLGAFPVAVEVIPMARSVVARQIVKMGGACEYRENFITDNGNQILDVYGLKLTDALSMEMALNNIPGVVCNGIFAANSADVLLLSTDSGLKTFKR